MSVIYPTLADVKAVHRREVEASGGASGVRDEGALEAAVMRPRQTFAGVELYPELVDKAAALFESIVGSHPFVDGNKRAAVVVAVAFLEVNGLRFGATNDQVERFTLEAAGGEHDFEAIRAWLREHTDGG